MNAIDIFLWIWFAVTFFSVGCVAWDLFTSTPEMKVMKWGWILVTLYTGVIGLGVYWLSCREPAPGTHEKFVAPLWKQSIGSTIHCLAGDATGIIVAASITSFLKLPMGIDAAIEYVAGFAFGLFVFQALFMKDMLGGSYWQAVKGTILPEWLSMNAVMSAMIPVMIILMTRDMRAMEPTSIRFWGIMSLSSLVGAILAYPANYWLVSKKLKHGMGTERALGKGGSKIMTATSVALHEAAMTETISEMSEPTMSGMKMDKSAISSMQPANASKEAPSLAAAAHDMTAMGEKQVEQMNMGDTVPGSSKLVLVFITLAMLVSGGFLAARYGDVSMRAGDGIGQTPMDTMPMRTDGR